MFRHGFHEDFSHSTTFHWYLLSFLSGSVNAGGFLASHRFVTHVTGFVTLSGIDLSSGDWMDAIGILTVPMFFLGGVIVAACLTEWRRHRALSPDYTIPMGLVSLFLLAAAMGGHFDLFGKFGEDPQVKYDYVFMALLCAASGLQNAAITTSSGYSVRLTHLTGITTDLGIGLVEAFACFSNPKKYLTVQRRNLLRLGTILSFFLGGCGGTLLCMEYDYLGFLLPAVIAAYAAYVAKNYSF